MDTDTALVIIDMQMEMQHRIDAGQPHINPHAPAAIAALAAAFRDAGHPVIHVRHAEGDSTSPLHPDAPGYPPMECARERPGEAVFVKCSSSAFATTGLEAHLRERGIAHIHVVGAVAGFCVNSTVRAASDLGFRVTVVRDAVIGFDLPSAGLEAGVIFDVTMGLLAADFVAVAGSEAVLARL
ncbi:isochorismatase family protein [Sphingomonas sanguinis]|uniref:isochorismatase family protein n=1 Tax=Sphingomonas sanguinis TaxID=33051 RepID=UPI001C55995D|nr:isochorismatase family protein [Sphingomonas sanguinis]QXT36816.1 isochorismatase family protein [Sphingomonas sanguinis]